MNRLNIIEFDMFKNTVYCLQSKKTTDIKYGFITSLRNLVLQYYYANKINDIDYIIEDIKKKNVFRLLKYGTTLEGRPINIIKIDNWVYKDYDEINISEFCKVILKKL